MSLMSAFLERMAHDGLTASEYTAIVFYILTALLLMLTYAVVRQDWAEIAAWASLGSVAVAIHFMLVGWRELALPYSGTMPMLALNQSEDIGGRIRDCPECPEMVVVQPGYFVMGADDAAAGPEEGPLRRMMIGRRFALSRSAISSNEWAAFARATGASSKACTGSVACMSWQDAVDYTQWLSRKAGKIYRLPSAAEWEYAARAGTAGPATAGAASLVRASFPTPATAQVPNGFGIAGMSHATIEFVEDCWSSTLAPLPSDGRALKPPSGIACRNRVVKYGIGSGHSAIFRPSPGRARCRSGDCRVPRRARSAGLC